MRTARWRRPNRPPPSAPSRTETLPRLKVTCAVIGHWGGDDVAPLFIWNTWKTSREIHIVALFIHSPPISFIPTSKLWLCKSKAAEMVVMIWADHLIIIQFDCFWAKKTQSSVQNNRAEVTVLLLSVWTLSPERILSFCRAICLTFCWPAALSSQMITSVRGATGRETGRSRWRKRPPGTPTARYKHVTL